MSKIFPKSVNSLPLQIVIYLFVLASIATAAVTYYMTPKYTRIGYAPVQPVPFSHAIHAGQLGLDCRYCHNNVEKSPNATVPTSQTCMNCHSIVLKDSPLLAVVRASYESGNPVPWVRIHQLPDFVYFNHAIHVNRGISCYECHGQINQMDRVQETQALSMGFCINCHRDPAAHIRPRAEVYDLNWHAASKQAQLQLGNQLVHDWKVDPPQSCSGCHR
ncbi:MAG TPA: cytochrome c3 family protein [Opitutaceae bacterium]|nr:cytochrome c3 family protein [Opitutaceae bacterium]